MMAEQPPKKAFTCFYWMNGGCKHSSEQCKFVHEYTERVAKPPKPPRYIVREGRLGSRNLIDLLSDEEASNDSKDFDSGDTSDEAGEVKPAHVIIRAIESGRSPELIRELFSNYTQPESNGSISPEDKLVILSVAIECDRPDLVEVVLENGADPRGVIPNAEIPFLACAILSRSSAAVEIIKMLLTSGADPFTVPKALWIRGTHTTYDPAEEEDDNESSESELKALADTLAESMNISVKNILYQASQLLPPFPGDIGNHLREFAIRITRAELALVGQRDAIMAVKRILIAKFMTRRHSPLVMAFAGPLGHGKSTLAKALGEFIPISRLRMVETAGNDSEDEGFHDNARNATASLNNLQILYVDQGYAAEYLRLVSFLDGDDSYYYIHRGRKIMINKGNLVCIVATTNLRESENGLYCRYREYVHTNQESYMRNDLETALGASLASHIGCVIPFLPFSKDEAVVLVHSYLLRAIDSLYKFHCSLHLHGFKHRELANITFYLDASVKACENLVEMSYIPTLGARSLEQGVFKIAQSQMMDQYLKSDLMKGSNDVKEADAAYRDSRCVTVTISDKCIITFE